MTYLDQEVVSGEERDRDSGKGRDKLDDKGPAGSGDPKAAQAQSTEVNAFVQAKGGGPGGTMGASGESGHEASATSTGASSSTGASLPDGVRSKMEGAFNEDFSDVRIHEDGMAESLGAQAYAQGRDIHFAPGRYQPDTEGGQELLGHELTHVVQQSQGRVKATGQAKGLDINDDQGLEREADVQGAKAARGERVDIPGRSGSAGGVAPVQRAANPGSPMQFGRRKQKEKRRKRQRTLRENEQALTAKGLRGQLRNMGRELRELAMTIRAFNMSEEAKDEKKAHAFYAALPNTEKTVTEREERVAEIIKEAGVVGSEQAVIPPIIHNAREAIQNARKALRAIRKTHPYKVYKLGALYSEAQGAQEEGQFDVAYEKFQEVESTGNSLKIKGEEKEWDYKQLMSEIAKSCPGGRKLQSAYADAFLLPSDEAKEVLDAAIDKRFKEAERGALKDEAPTFLKDFKAAPEVVSAMRSITRILAERGKTEAKKSYEASAPTILTEDSDLKEAYLGMTASKGGVDANNPAELKKSLIAHLQLNDNKFKDQDIDAILQAGLSNKAERLKLLFEDSPGLLEKCTRLVKNQSLHRTLEQIKSGDKEHSIKDVNDYVGDKLNEPLMRWVIEKNIPVEVHATSLLSSFAKMKSDGFTDIIEIPSTHTGTKKWVCVNPETKKAKVVFQTLPGESYAIQTAGAFLFYEIYDVAPEVKTQLGADDLTAPEQVGDSSTFTYPGYKARNEIEHDKEGKKATFLLVKDDDGSNVAAEVSYTANAPHIGGQGEIVLGAAEVNPTIKIKDVDVKSLDKSKLSVFKEDVDYTSMYIDLMKTHGVTHADIACIGRKNALKASLDKEGVKPTNEVTLPHFNMSVFELKKGDGSQTLLSFSISPEFFGDKSGHLVTALNDIGVKHITFVGTSGGLAEDSKVGDIMVPEKLKNYSSGSMGDNTLTNKASEMMGAFGGDENVDSSKFRSDALHVGVHSPITESQEMIDAMKSEAVSSVDCEAGFIADALKGSNVSLYALFFVGDVPGTQHSIGMGGVGGEMGDQVEQEGSAPTEQAVLHIIKGLLGEKIAQADRDVTATRFPIKNNAIKNLTVLGGKEKKGQLTFDIKLPSSQKKGEAMIGALQTFNLKLDAILTEAEGQVDARTQSKIFNLVRQFHSQHGILIMIDYIP